MRNGHFFAASTSQNGPEQIFGVDNIRFLQGEGEMWTLHGKFAK